MKKLFSLALTLLMALTLCVPAMAALEITIDPKLPAGGTDGAETYTAYRIFDATYSAADETNPIGKISYTIDSASPFFNTIKDFKVSVPATEPGGTPTLANAFKLTRVGTSTTYLVEAVNYSTADHAAALSVELKKVIDDSTKATALASYRATGAYITEAGDDQGKYKISVAQKGYYVIVSSLGSKMIVDTLGDVDIATKNDYPTLTKKIVSGTDRVDSITADRGNTITFEVTVNIPVTAVGAITVHDELGTGMTYGSLAANTYVTQKSGTPTDGCTVEFEISAEKVAAVAAAAIDDDEATGTVTFQYTATLNTDAALDTAHKNVAYLTYANYTSAEDEVSVYTYQIEVYKYTMNGNQKVGLAGAGFVLKNSEGKYYQNIGGEVKWVDIDYATEYKTTDAVGTSGQEGYKDAVYSVFFTGLKNGTYTIVENTVPDGYNPLAVDPTRTITDHSYAGEKTDNNPTYHRVEVENNTGMELPSTGGMGTTIFYTVGGILMAGAVILLITKKKMSSEEQ